MQSSADIRARFESEQEYVVRYVEFLREAAAVKQPEISKLSEILRRHDLSNLEISWDPRKWHEPYTVEEMAALSQSIRALLPDVDKKLAEYENHLNELPDLTDFWIINTPPSYSEWVMYLTEALSGDSSPEAIAAVKQEVLDQEKKIIDEMGDDAEVMSPEAVDVAVRSALINIAEANVRELLYLQEKFRQLDLAERMTKPGAEINVHRQGFILLLTAFDAAVFDLVRLALTQDFFRLIASFGKQDKISLEQIARHGRFEALRDHIIEDQLKAKYLKDLLFLLQELKVQLVDTAAEEKFIELVELVMRRNIHVHNRGIVDERYLERNQQGQPQYNFYNLSLGDVAEIDQSYWKRANGLCLHCIENLAAWVDSRSATPIPTP